MKDDEEKDEIKPNKSRSFLKQSKPEVKFDLNEKKTNDEDDEIPRLSLDNSTMSTYRDCKCFFPSQHLLVLY